MTLIMATLGTHDGPPWADQLPQLLATDVVDAVRINVTRWSEEQIRGAVGVVRELRPETNILIDLGQKLRLRPPGEKKLYVRKGNVISIARNPYTYPMLRKLTFRRDMTKARFKVGDLVLIRDGKLRGTVCKETDTHVDIQIEFAEEGENYINVFSGITFPNTDLKRCVYGERELAMIKLAAKLQVDMIASSFIESAEDIQELLEVLGDWEPIIVPKIESQRGVENINEIIDALPEERRLIMIARGDLFVETGPVDFGCDQQIIIDACHDEDTPFIVATGVLRSMRTNLMPERSEVIDVFYAVRNDAAYLMTAEETNNSPHPVKVVEMLHAIIQHAR